MRKYKNRIRGNRSRCKSRSIFFDCIWGKRNYVPYVLCKDEEKCIEFLENVK